MILSESESNPYTNIIRKIKLLLLTERTNPLDATKNLLELLSFIEKLGKGRTFEAFCYFIEHEASTTLTISVDLNMSEATSYRVVKKLRSLRIIEPRIRVKHPAHQRGGPRPTVYALIDTSPEKIAEAISKHYRVLNPKYRTAEEIVQKILKEYGGLGREITGSSLSTRIRLHGFTGSELYDVKMISIQLLKSHGVKVWT